MIEYGGRDITFTAVEDLSSHQFMFVHQADDDTVDLVDSGTEYPVGVLQNAPADTEIAVVRIEGTSKLVMNDAVAVGAKVKCEYVGATDNGKGDAADTDGDLARGVCIGASGAEDDVGAILLCSDTLSIPA